MRRAVIYLLLFLMVGTALVMIVGRSNPVAAREKRPMKAELIGYEEVPSVSTSAGGEFRARISGDETSIEYELSFDGLEATVTQSHIHVGQMGVNGGISVFLCQGTVADPTGLAPTCPQSGTVTGTLTAANVIGPGGQGVAAMEFAELVQAIRSSVAYVNVHSVKFPGGEVRGQLK